jgi:hypothetical protein
LLSETKLANHRRLSLLLDFLLATPAFDRVVLDGVRHGFSPWAEHMQFVQNEN